MLAVTVTPHKITQAVILSLQHAMEARNLQAVGGGVCHASELAWLMLCAMGRAGHHDDNTPWSSSTNQV